MRSRFIFDPRRFPLSPFALILLPDRGSPFSCRWRSLRCPRKGSFCYSCPEGTSFGFESDSRFVVGSEALTIPARSSGKLSPDTCEVEIWVEQPFREVFTIRHSHI